MKSRTVLLSLMIPMIAVNACTLLSRAGSEAATSGALWTCAPPESDVVSRLQAWVRGYADPQSALADTVRMQLQLPRVPGDSVAVVRAPATCAEAGRTYARDGNQRLPPGTYEMAVIRAGDRFVVRGATAPIAAGEWNIIFILDRRFRHKAGVLGF